MNLKYLFLYLSFSCSLVNIILPTPPTETKCSYSLFDFIIGLFTPEESENHNSTPLQSINAQKPYTYYDLDAKNTRRYLKTLVQDAQKNTITNEEIEKRLEPLMNFTANWAFLPSILMKIIMKEENIEKFTLLADSKNPTAQKLSAAYRTTALKINEKLKKHQPIHFD
ncbi:MAG: hypothetical protein AB7E68_04225 [Candidatus Babeliales bacterium]